MERTKPNGENSIKTKNFTYILRCADGSLYTGWTNDLRKRLRAHNEGRGAKYTRARRPAELVYFECFSEKGEAMRREYEIKQLTRRQKETLILKAGHFRKTGSAAHTKKTEYVHSAERETEQKEIMTEQPTTIKKGIVCFDLDHTLLDNANNEICPSAQLAVKKLRENGYLIAIASGRDMDNYYSYMYRDIVKPDAIVHQNGTRVAVRTDETPYDAARGSSQYQLIYDHFMDPALVRAVVQYAEENHICVGTTIAGKDYFVNPGLKEKADASYNKFLKRNFVPADGLWKLPVRAMSYAGTDAERNKQEIAAFHARFPQIRLLMFSTGQGADMVETCCSKANGLHCLCDYYGIPIEKTWAFGDSENDIELLRAAGTGIAVGNAMPEVKAVADYITEDIRHDGIYLACVKLGMIADENGQKHGV